MTQTARYLLIQIRAADDVVREQEIRCFVKALDCEPEQLVTFDLLNETLTSEYLSRFDLVLIGGSGRYSVTSEEPWLYRALEGLSLLVKLSKPTFGSCWGFQALARATGGVVEHDLPNAELGSHPVYLTEAGEQDPLFSTMPPTFLAYMGHEDHVVKLPPDTILLASSDRVPEQAFRYRDKPIYCTQFHPELDHASLCARVSAYPEYCERIAAVPFDEFVANCQDASDTNRLLRNFRDLVLE
ncbi:MAG: type 1 glutamine amidotransferase [Pirellulaceae bacterium]